MPTNIKVSITCITYNHEPYIRKVLDSFVSQVVNFSYEIIIHDDASTDGTQEIIMEYVNNYPELFVPILQKENQYSRGKNITADFVFPLVKGEYIAMCEGDDYWPDIHKLQKQVEFLDSHPECGAVAGLTRYFNDNMEECLAPKPSPRYLDRYVDEEAFLNDEQANIATNTLMYRSDIIHCEKYLAAKRASPHVGDILMILKIYEIGKIYVMSDCFQHHTVQTRKNASNYNSIFGWEKRFLDVICVVNAVTEYYEQKHDLSRWFRRYVLSFYLRAIMAKEKKKFYEIYDKVVSEYKDNMVRIFFSKEAVDVVGKGLKRIIGG